MEALWFAIIVILSPFLFVLGLVILCCAFVIIIILIAAIIELISIILKLFKREKR